jgi:hypothetical protein
MNPYILQLIRPFDIDGSLIRYGNGENIPFLEISRGGGKNDYSDEEKISGGELIDLDLIE